MVVHGATPFQIDSMVSDNTDLDHGLKTLVDGGMIMQEGNGIVISHSLIQQVAEASIPAEVRRDLHERAGELVSEMDMPREARAMHALLARGTFNALLLLDQTGEAALCWDDVDSAVLAFRQCLDVARREISNGELDDPMRAVVVFSRKLGDALSRSGDVTGAEGVLRESLDLTDPNSVDRAYVLFSLAKLERTRSRLVSASQYLREAIDVARKTGSDALVEALRSQNRAWDS